MTWACYRCGSTGTGKQPRRNGRSPLCTSCTAALRALGMRWCGRCQAPKAMSAFRLDRGRVRAPCLACGAEARRGRYAANHEAEKARKRAHYWRNPARFRAAQQTRYHADVVRSRLETRRKRARTKLRILRAP